MVYQTLESNCCEPQHLHHISCFIRVSNTSKCYRQRNVSYGLIFNSPLDVANLMIYYMTFLTKMNIWRARWKKGVSDDLRLKSKLLLVSWTLAHRLIFMWGMLLCTYFLTWDLKFEELAYYFCVKSFVELNSLKWCVKDLFCSLPTLKQRNST